MSLINVLTVLAVVAIAHAGVIAPVAYTVPVDADYDPNPHYSYAYDVEDSVTGDSKNHHETRQGDVVHGSYSLTDSDGTRRTVDYTADPVHGFNAVVRKEPLVHAAPIAAKITAPVVAKISAPLVAKAAPIAYTAPAHVPAAVVKTVPVAHEPVPVAYAAYTAPFAAYGAHPYYARYAATPYAFTAPLAYSAPVVAKVSAPLVTKIAHL
uniref:Uncharacterized protein n=1 Tax=Cuerna arida TaxID=1464854 RepID=A0A1B6FSV0_9HEMI